MKQSPTFDVDATSQQPVNASDACQYVADMALELRGLCKQNDLGYLAYLLEIVFIEANGQLARMMTPQTPSADD